MPDKVVLDSSVIAAMFFREEASHRVLKELSDYFAITVDLAIAELGNVAWKQVTFAGESRELARDALEDALEFIVESCKLHEKVQAKRNIRLA
jgi:predicted nucleic acid-binding protein